MPSIIFKTNRNNLEIVAKGKSLPTISEFLHIMLTFCMVVFAWVFFRANNVTHALNYLGKIFSRSLFSMPDFEISRLQLLQTIALIVFFIIIEWNGRENQYAIETLTKLKKRNYRLAFYYALVLILFLFAGKEQQFIYFQF